MREPSLETLRVVDLGRMGYAPAYDEQCRHVEEVLAARAIRPEVGRLLLVEHDPVITVSRRAGAGAHVLATPGMLETHGVAIEATDRGGDVTYHGPGQLVLYPILDLNLLNLNVHDHMRLLEQSVIDACARFGIEGRRDPGATGVWVTSEGRLAKICAFGVRVRKWVSMHGLAINVTTNLAHFDLIVPCGLAGRPVTSLERELGERSPGLDEVKRVLVACLSERVGAAAERACERRA